MSMFSEKSGSNIYGRHRTLHAGSFHEFEMLFNLKKTKLLCNCKLLEVTKHEWYHVVTNYLGHVFIPSLKLSKVVKKRVDFHVNALKDEGRLEVII